MQKSTGMVRIFSCLKMSAAVLTYLTIKHNGHTIQSKANVALLDIKLDSRLDWKSHVEDLVNKTNSLTLLILNQYSGATQYGKNIHFAKKKCIREIYNFQKTKSWKPVFTKKEILTFLSLHISEAFLFVRGSSKMFEI